IHNWILCRYGVKNLINQIGKEIVYSVEYHKSHSEEVSLFSRFIEGRFPLSHLSFFLLLRSVAICSKQGYEGLCFWEYIPPNYIPTGVAIGISALFFSYLNESDWDTLYDVIVNECSEQVGFNNNMNANRNVNQNQNQNQTEQEKNNTKDNKDNNKKEEQRNQLAKFAQLMGAYTPSATVPLSQQKGRALQSAISQAYQQSSPSSQQQQQQEQQLMQSTSTSIIYLPLFFRLLMHTYHSQHKNFIKYVKELFDVYDTDNDDEISFEEFHDFMLELSPFLSDQEPGRMISMYITQTNSQTQQQQQQQQTGMQRPYLNVKQVIDILETHEIFRKNVCGTVSLGIQSQSSGLGISGAGMAIGSGSGGYYSGAQMSSVVSALLSPYEVFKQQPHEY
ncbi:MAG: hypothetical protein EZS28_045422, partial [Streblomastix strix]